jgi:Zn-dependent protease
MTDNDDRLTWARCVLRVSCHEAGHALMAEALGYDVETMLLDHPAGLLGQTLTRTTPRDDSHTALISAAGPVAESILFGGDPRSLLSAADDPIEFAIHDEDFAAARTLLAATPHALLARGIAIARDYLSDCSTENPTDEKAPH